MSDLVVLVLSIAMAMVCSCLCSLLEAALLSLTPSQLATLRQRSSRIGKICQGLKHDIDKPIAVILIFNTAAHTIGASISGAKFGLLTGQKDLWIFSLAFTLLMVQYTEILPKTLGVRFNRTIMYVSARPLQIAVWVMLPLIRLTHWINRPFERRGSGNKIDTADEIMALAAMARSNQTISTRQERIIRAVPMLSERTAQEVMLPVENISFISSNQSLTDAIAYASIDFHTRYPVCENGDKNKVLGYINFKELVVVANQSKDKKEILDIVRPIGFAVPDDTAADLLDNFTVRHCHMTIVRDDDGKTAGLVTMEDIVEELLGDLDDEFDHLPRTFYSPSEYFWVVGGGIPMTVLARDSHLDLPRRAEPVAVWFSRQLNRVPKVGDVVRHGNAEFYARKIRRGQVLEFNLRRSKG